MLTARAALLSLLALSACTGEPSDPLCPPGTRELGGICRRGCAADDECLRTERCDPSAAACVPRVAPPPPSPAPTITRFWVAPETITQPGQTVSVFYEVEDATEVEISPNVMARTSVLSQTIFASFQDTTTLTLTAYGQGQTSAERTVVLAGGGVAIQSFTAAPTAAEAGDTVTLAWRVVNEAAGTIRISDPVGGRWLANAAVEAGQLTDRPRELPVEYWLEATGADGRVVRASAVVLPAASAPRIDVFEAAPATIRPGDTALLRWSTAGGSSISVVGPGLDDASSDPLEVARGFRLVAPTATADYGALVLGASGAVAQDQTRLEVRRLSGVGAPVFGAASIEPVRRSQQSPVSNVSVRWEAADADQVTLYANGAMVGAFDASDRRTLPGSAAENLRVELLASGAGGYDEAELTSYYVVGEAEPNDGPSSADEANRVARLGVVLTTQVDLDWYAVDVPEGGRVEASLVGRANGACEPVAPLVLELVGPDGSAVLARAVPGGGGCPRVAAEHLGAGRHYLRVGPGARLGEGAEYILLADARAPRCGDGVAEGAELCDDGNRLSGDGCDGLCGLETPPAYAVARRTLQALPSPMAPALPVRWSGTLADRAALIALPFPFVFYGRQYAGVVVHERGYLSFRPPPEDAGASAAIPTSAAPNALVAALWGEVVLADFAGARGEVLYWPRGMDAQTQHPRLDILYRNLTGRGHTEADHALIDVLVSLEAETNVVRLYYGQPKVVGAADAVSFVAGIEDELGRAGEPVPGCVPVCGALSGPAGQLYSFTPE